MIEDAISQIRRIFVGRHSELQKLMGLWGLACSGGEHLVYVFLNAPGVGKTTLINKFGVDLESEGKGIYIRLRCSQNVDTRLKMKKEILQTIKKTLKQKSRIVSHYWDLNKNEIDLEKERGELQLLEENLDNFLAKLEIDLYDIYEILSRLSNIIPIFFAADEIQEYQKINFKEVKDGSEESETGLHYLTQILKDLLDSRILLVLSGTRYHILSQIGAEIGSPIRQKVKPIIIQKFEKEEILAYVDEVKKLIDIADIKEEEEDILAQINNYRQFLFAFSGGHPRTIENITDHFLNSLPHLLSNDKYKDYDVFMDFLLPKLEEFFANTLLSSYYKEQLSSLAASEEFSVIKEWILSKATLGQFLGERPKLSDNSQSDEEIRRIIYELMNIGVIVQNGDYNYHLTSYFHFIEFLNLYNEPYEQFLKEVLHNRYFKLMCGFHSGFGHTFENIFTSALIIRGSKIRQEMPINLELSNLRGLRTLKGKINWSELSIQKDILYQTPLAESIDGFVIHENELFLIQITTANPPDPLKKDALLSEINKISKFDLKVGKEVKISGWLVSLFKFEKEMLSHKNLIVTDGDKLIPILGKELFSKLKAVKNSFK